MKLFLSPHNDDEALFGAFTIMRERAAVAIVFDSMIQEQRGAGITAPDRRMETLEAMDILAGEDDDGITEWEPDVRLLGFSDAAPDPFAIEAAFRKFGQPDMVYAPAVEVDGHPHHNLVGELAAKVFTNVTHYMTYTKAGKSVGREVPIEDGAWIGRKLRALACYESQHRIDPRIGCWPHFTRDLTEYYA